MARFYTGLTVEQLLEKHAMMLKAIEESALNGGVIVIQAEGRREEYTGSDKKALYVLFDQVCAELGRRPGYEQYRRTRSIAVEIR